MTDDLVHSPLEGINDFPCNDFAPDTLGDNPDVCTTCFYHKDDHLSALEKMEIESYYKEYKGAKSAGLIKTKDGEYV